MKPHIFVYIHYLEIGGAERALIGLLNALDPERVDIDLFLNQHTGEFMSMIPPYVRLLPQVPQYSAIERPIKDIVKEGHIGIAIRRLLAKRRHARHLANLTQAERKIDESIFQYVFRDVLPGLPDLSHLGQYDLAISFLHPHNIVMEKVRARKKICWVHTDYSTIHVDRDLELPVWNSYDRIFAISDKAVKAFTDTFPTLTGKTETMENILSVPAIRAQADTEDVTNEMPDGHGLKILSIGRFGYAKRFDEVPRICRTLKDNGLEFRWYIVGYGDDKEIRENIERYGVQDVMILLGKKANPYPYLKHCDIYAQPSRYEGKSVTVREAQILCKPVIVSNYPTATSQIIDGVDGRIAPYPTDDLAIGILEFARDSKLRRQISDYLSQHDYGNHSEAEKIYKILDQTEK